MELDLAAYGAGLGLVMIGWISGLVVSYAFSLAKGVKFF